MGMSVQTRAMLLPFVRPFSFGGRRVEKRPVLLLRLEVDGLVGWGEAAPLPGFLEAPIADIERCLMRWAEEAGALEAVVAPESPARIAAALDTAHPDAASRLAAAALDTALSDAAARRAGLPLARWLVPGATLRVPSNRLLPLEDPARACADAQRLRAAGVEAVKVKLLPGQWREQLRVLAEVLGRVGGLRVRADANAHCEPGEAAALLAALAPFPVEYVEEPLDLRFGVEEFLRLADRSPLPLAADERLLDPDQREALLAADWRGVFVLKPMFLGGPRPTLSLARRAAEQGIRSTVTTALDGAVGRAMAQAVACAVEGLGIGTGAHGLDTDDLLASDIPLAPSPTEGPGLMSARAPTNGLGCTPHWPDAEGAE